MHMTCPRCEEGQLINVVLKMTGEEAVLCDFCETLWLHGEEIAYNTGHPYDKGEHGDKAYTIETSEEKDQEHKVVRYPNVK